MLSLLRLHSVDSQLWCRKEVFLTSMMSKDFDQIYIESDIPSHFRIRQFSRLCRFARIFSQILAFTLALLYLLEHSTYYSPTVEQSLELKSTTNLETFMNVTNGNFNKTLTKTTNNPAQGVRDDFSSNIFETSDETSKVNTYFSKMIVMVVNLSNMKQQKDCA